MPLLSKRSSSLAPNHPEGSFTSHELAEIAQEILRRRGGDAAIDPGAFGKRLKLLGFRTEPRDAKGMKIRFTEDVCRRARQLARDVGVPQVEDAATTSAAAKGA